MVVTINSVWRHFSRSSFLLEQNVSTRGVFFLKYITAGKCKVDKMKLKIILFCNLLYLEKIHLSWKCLKKFEISGNNISDFIIYKLKRNTFLGISNVITYTDTANVILKTAGQSSLQTELNKGNDKLSYLLLFSFKIEI